MPIIYSRVKCGKCKAIAIGVSGNILDVIGPPFFQCLQCRTINRRPGVTEWDLKSGPSKLAFYILAAINAVAWGFGIGAFIGGVIESRLSNIKSNSLTITVGIAFVPLVVG